jgi:hypothetical protein
MSNRSELQAYLDRPLDDLMDELSLYAPTERSPADVWAKIAGPVRQRLCVEWDYCTVRQDARWADDLDLAMVVLGELSARALNLPVQADLLLVSTIVVKRGLDALCGCFDLAAD